MLNKVKKLWGLIFIIGMNTLFLTSKMNAELSTQEKSSFETFYKGLTTGVAGLLSEVLESTSESKWSTFASKINELNLAALRYKIKQLTLKEDQLYIYRKTIDSIATEIIKTLGEKKFNPNIFFVDPKVDISSYAFSLKKENPEDELSKNIKILQSNLIAMFKLLNDAQLEDINISEDAEQLKTFEDCLEFLNKKQQEIQAKKNHTPPPTTGSASAIKEPSTKESYGEKPVAPKKTDENEDENEYEPHFADVPFTKIIGMDKKLLADINQFVSDINPSAKELLKRKITKATPPRGVLLDGPPGTGKTTIARAISTAAKVRFLQVNASTIMGQFQGSGATNIEKIFKTARGKRDNDGKVLPCIIFMDEIDSIGYSRQSTKSNGEHLRTINSLLTAIGDIRDDEPIYVLAATNNIQSLDEALIRPGRFDRKITVPHLNKEGRLESLKKIRDEGGSFYEKISDKLLEKIAAETQGYIYGDFKNIFTIAVGRFEGEIDESTRLPDSSIESAFETVQREHGATAAKKSPVIPISRGDRPVNLARTILIELTSLHDCSTITSKLSSFLEETIKKDGRLSYNEEEKAGIASLVEQTEKMLDYVEDGCIMGGGTVNIKLIDGAPSNQPGQFTLFGKTISISFVRASTSNNVKPQRKPNRTVKKSVRRKRLAEQRRVQKAQQLNQQNIKLLHDGVRAMIAQKGEKQTTAAIPVEERARQLFTQIQSSAKNAFSLTENLIDQRGVIDGLVSARVYDSNDNRILKELSLNITKILDYLKLVAADVSEQGHEIKTITATETDQKPTQNAGNKSGAAMKLGDKVFVITFETKDRNEGAAEALEKLKPVKKITPPGSSNGSTTGSPVAPTTKKGIFS